MRDSRDPLDHIDDETLELYALDRIKTEGELALIEEHLLVCYLCQDRLQTHDKFIGSLRAGFQHLGWTHIHQTDDGEVRMSVHKGPDGRHIARIVGAGVDCGSWRASADDARLWCETSFGEMFPEHACGPE